MIVFTVFSLGVSVITPADAAHFDKRVKEKRFVQETEKSKF